MCNDLDLYKTPFFKRRHCLFLLCVLFSIRSSFLVFHCSIVPVKYGFVVQSDKQSARVMQPNIGYNRKATINANEMAAK